MNLNVRLRILFLLSCFISIGMSAQKNMNVQGKVVDATTGESIIGANIVIKGTTIGTITDFDGNFTLEANVGSTLTATFIGYVPQEIKLKDTQPLRIKLVENAKELGEVVVVGYGTQKKISSIGAQSSVKMVSDLKQPVAHMSSSLSGRISGLIGQQSSGAPGDNTSNIWIRGIATLGGTSPLIMVDGVERSMDELNPEDIESVSIMKDASATAVFGVRGANGVIIINTKQGRIGKPQIRAEYNFGVTDFTKVPRLADGVTYMNAANEAFTTRGKDAFFSEEKIQNTIDGIDPYLNPTVDWFDELFTKMGTTQNASLSVNGGTENVQYYVSASMYSETGQLTRDKAQTFDSGLRYKRFNVNSNINMKITKTTDLKVNVKVMVEDANKPKDGASRAFSDAMNMPPVTMPVRYPNGEIPFISTGGGLMNPWAELTQTGYESNVKSKMMADITMKQDLSFLLKGLNFRAMFAYDTYNRSYIKRTKNYDTYWADSRDENGELILNQTNQQGSASPYLTTSGGTTDNTRKYYFEASLNYAHTFNKLHNVTGMLMVNLSDRLNLRADNLVASLPYRSTGLAGRFTYGFNERYMVEFNFGYNGSENFNPDKRFGFFPSVGAAWVISNERWFEPISKTISLLKFRTSYGLVGNDQIKINGNDYRFGFLSEMDGNASGYQFGTGGSTYNVTNGYQISKYGANVTWETAKKFNFGFDLNLFNDMLAFNVDFFKERRENIFLMRSSIPQTMGLTGNIVGNLGIVDNKGFEINVDFNKRINKWDLGVKGTMSYNKNKIVEDDSPQKPYAWMDRRGSIIGQQYGYICDGFYTQEEIDNPDVAKTAETVLAGDLKYRDLNDDKIIDEYDKTYIGRGTVPRITYGFGTTIGYKGFTLGAFFQGVGQNDIYVNGSFVPFQNGTAKGNILANITDRWTESNPRQDAFYPRLNYASDNNQNYASSTHWIVNGAYLRLKTLDFGYTFPASMTHKLRISTLRLYTLLSNVLTFSSFALWDPELGNGSGSKYPNIATYSVGLSFQF
ncbi:SusC/RagA family TonB-linked outer membrane protein [Bacteroides sp. AN502(2024)]|uniref:SusC/RagA family TonB-linked outer membrane protein n=1 Tax=Bacteroides sp. AN502(2024) TaxID=3160599 RepID=UPI00351658F9